MIGCSFEIVTGRNVLSPAVTPLPVIITACVRIVEHGAVEAEPVPEIGELFDSGAEGVQVRIAIIGGGTEVAHAEVDPRSGDLILDACIEARLPSEKDGRIRALPPSIVANCVYWLPTASKALRLVVYPSLTSECRTKTVRVPFQVS
jgi:hypothetical protein